MSFTSRHPWGRRPDACALTERLGRGIRAGCFDLRDQDLIGRAGAHEVLAFQRQLRQRGIFIDPKDLGNGYDPLGELLQGAPECPMLRRYFELLFQDGAPDPLHVERKFRRVVRSFTYKRAVGILAANHPHEHNVRRLIRVEAKELGIASSGRRLLFVPGRNGLEPMSTLDHWNTLLRTCPPRPSVRDLLGATRTLLQTEPSVAGWMPLADVVQDYLWFFASRNTSRDRHIDRDTAELTMFMKQLRGYWLSIRDTLRAECLRSCRSEADIAALDFRAFADGMNVFFETGVIESRWMFWREYFPEIQSSLDFQRSPHKRRADTLWRKLREAFIARFGPGGDA